MFPTNFTEINMHQTALILILTTISVGFTVSDIYYRFPCLGTCTIGDVLTDFSDIGCALTCEKEDQCKAFRTEESGGSVSCQLYSCIDRPFPCPETATGNHFAKLQHFYTEIGTARYRYVASPKLQYSQSQQYCAQEYAKLAEPLTSTQATLLKDWYLAIPGVISHANIGLQEWNQIVKDSQGNPTNALTGLFYGNEPNDASGLEPCLAIELSYRKFIDVACGVTVYICQLMI